MGFQFGFDLDGHLDDDGNRLGIYTFTQSYIDKIPPGPDQKYLRPLHHRDFQKHFSRRTHEI
mgnify:CR=1 FL=1